MIRSWGLQTFTGAGQPAFGDKLTAAFTGNKGSNGFYIATVADTSKYEVGDGIVIGVGSGNPVNTLRVGQIPDGTHLYLQSEGDAPVSAWPVNTVTALKFTCANIFFYNNSSADSWIGSDTTVTTSGGGSGFQKIFSSGSFNLPAAQWNIYQSDEYYLAGTLSDTFGVSAIVI